MTTNCTRLSTLGKIRAAIYTNCLDRRAAKLLSKDEARRIVANIAKLPDS